MKDTNIDVIATTMSGSIADWAKVDRIIPLFQQHGYENVSLFKADSHAQARTLACESAGNGCRTIISAGGSGTFNAVLEGCCDSGEKLTGIRLGFLRKGSADLIGKALGMPDDIEQAIAVFAESIKSGKTIPCDALLAEDESGPSVPRHFVGYGGAEIFGEIPYFTENRFIKYYKGILSQLFGDLGPFFVGAVLASIRRQARNVVRKRRKWQVEVDEVNVSNTFYQALIIVNGDLGKDLPLAKGVPLGSGDFHMFALRDLGAHRLPGQFSRTWNASVQQNPAQWGFEHYTVKNELRLRPSPDQMFDINVDGSTMRCKTGASFRITDTINLITK